MKFILGLCNTTDMVGKVLSCGPRCFVDTMRNPILKNILSRSYASTNKCAPLCVLNPLLEAAQMMEVKYECGGPYRFDCFCSKPRVLIIGAGMAGLSAAHHLQINGITNYMILEAKDRIGGRIYTSCFGNRDIDVGCEYIHGVSLKNSVFQLAALEGIFDKPPSKPSRQYYYHTSDGRVVDPFVAAVATTTFQEIERCARMIFHSNDPNCFGNLQTFISLRVLQALHSFPKELKYDAANVMNGLTNHLRYHTGANLADVDTKLYGSRDFLSGLKVRIPNGFNRVLNPLVKEILHCNICLNKPVAKISSHCPDGTGKRTTVCCCDGEIFTADYVISTIPVGILGMEGQYMFEPPLSKEKQKALAHVCNGYCNKVALEYDNPFWSRGRGTFRLAWSGQELMHRDEWLKGVSMIEEAPGCACVLYCYVGGKEARTMEQCHLQDVAERITHLLRLFLNDVTIPFPSRILRSSWSLDQYIGASTYYLSVGSTIDAFKPICAPICGEDGTSVPTVLFAGDGFKREYLGTVHGARTSGIEAAERILELTCLLQGAPATGCGSTPLPDSEASRKVAC